MFPGTSSRIDTNMRLNTVFAARRLFGRTAVLLIIVSP